MITLVAIVCSGMLCQDVVIPTDNMVAGLASNPIPMPFTEMICRTGGMALAYDWLSMPNSPQHEQYKGWHIVKIMCVPGKYESSHRA